MRWCRFETEDGPSFGLIEADTIVQVDGSPFSEFKRMRKKRPLKEAKLLAPVDNPAFYVIGRNYIGHVEGRARAGAPMPPAPWAWWRSASAIASTDSDIIIPADCPDDVEYECEPIAVIGKGGKNFTRREAQDAIFGYTIGNDVTAMSWARSDPGPWRSKNCDTWKPVGPWIETDLDVEAAVCTVLYNGVEQVRWHINNWIYHPVDVLITISRYMTLCPGDILMLGAEGMSPFVQHNDVVEATISGLGTLRNRFVREQPRAQTG
jgi:2-keto-4-pentenoate hydratase/2-oxohepta-3-ene-1,7-dioic acid hydratase in catechol pathway